MKHYFITNPAAGKKNSCELLSESIHLVCEDKNVCYEIYETKGVRDATAFVKQVCENNTDGEKLRFYACGGDGTLGEVVTGAVNYPFASVGLIPKGTGNDFVRNFTKKELLFDIAAQLDGEDASIDVLSCNDMYAINMINIGFDCEVVKKMMKIKRFPLVPSKLAYILGLIITLIKKPGIRADISINGGEPVREELLLTTFANGAYCGGGFHSNPLASLSDGRLDSLLVSNVTRLKFISLVGDYKKGTHLSEKFKKIIRNKKCDEIRLAFEKHTNVCVDGEIINVKELVLSVLHGAITFRVPKGALPIAEHLSAKETVRA